MDVLIVTSRFFPHGDAQSSVVFNLAEGLKEKGCNVQVIGTTTYREDKEISNWKGIPVRQLFFPWNVDREGLKNTFKKSKIQGIYTSVIIICELIMKTVISKYRKYSIHPITFLGLKKGIKRALKEKKYDLCLPTLMPMDAVCAAFEACQGKVPVGIYQLDTYWNNVLLPEKYREYRFDFEKELISKSAFSMVLPMILQENQRHGLQNSSKIICADLPMIKRQLIDEPAVNKCEKHCVYLGTLYPGLRPPEKVIKIISLLQEAGFVFDFYGTRQDLIEESPDYEKAKKYIVLHGRVDSEEAERARNEADILINIDNTNISQVPSKLFEYISTGKPIVNFYFNPESAVRKYLSQYPLSININLNGDLNTEAKRLSLFLVESTNKRVPYDEVEKAFITNTPEYVAQQCISAYYSNLKPL